MLIDFDSVFNDLNDEAITVGKDKFATLSYICVDCLISPKGLDNATGTEKFELYELAMKIKPGGSIEMTPEEITKIKGRVGLVQQPLIVGQAFKALDRKGQ